MLQANSLLIQHLSPFNLVCPPVDKITQLKGFPFEFSVSEVKMACVLWKLCSLLVPKRHVWIVLWGLFTLSISGTAAPMKAFLFLAHSQGEPWSNAANYFFSFALGNYCVKSQLPFLAPGEWGTDRCSPFDCTETSLEALHSRCFSAEAWRRTSAFFLTLHF